MTRRFIEIQKVQTEEQIERGEPREEIRVVVADETGPEIIDRIAALRAGAGWTAADSTARLHICHHDDMPPQPCELIPEDEIA
jgi:hypothetical protein